MKKLISIHFAGFGFAMLGVLGGAHQQAFAAETSPIPYEIVHFPSGKLTLGGELFRPKGKGPFPAILYNHGSAG